MRPYGTEEMDSKSKILKLTPMGFVPQPDLRKKVCYIVEMILVQKFTHPPLWAGVCSFKIYLMPANYGLRLGKCIYSVCMRYPFTCLNQDESTPQAKQT